MTSRDNEAADICAFSGLIVGFIIVFAIVIVVAEKKPVQNTTQKFTKTSNITNLTTGDLESYSSTLKVQVNVLLFEFTSIKII